MKTWKTEIHTRGGSVRNRAAISSFKTYSLQEVAEIMKKQRIMRKTAGLPKPRLRPITTYLLEDLVQLYFRDYASKGDILEKIVIEDRG